MELTGFHCPRCGSTEALLLPCRRYFAACCACGALLNCFPVDVLLATRHPYSPSRRC